MSNGYRSIMVPSDSPYLPMADSRGRVYEHRFIVATSIGRCLATGEEVHHINGDKHDNRLFNLCIVSKRGHGREHREEVSRLRDEVSRLRAKLREADAS